MLSDCRVDCVGRRTSCLSLKSRQRLMKREHSDQPSDEVRESCQLTMVKLKLPRKTSELEGNQTIKSLIISCTHKK